MKQKRWKNKIEIRSNSLHEEVKADYSILPPRVVVYDILSFVKKRLISTYQKVPEKRYSLFGYFRKDRLRNIWYIYVSVHACRLDGKCPPKSSNEKYIPFVSICRVQNLFLRLSSPILLERLSKLAGEMVSLEKLAIDMRRPPETQFFKWSDLFSQPKCFPRMKRLELYGIIREYMEYNIQNLVSFSNIEMWKNLQSIDILPRCGNQDFGKLFSHQLVNLRKLHLSLDHRDVSACCVDAPNLEVLYLHWDGGNASHHHRLIKVKKETLKSLKHLELNSFGKIFLDEISIHLDSLESVQLSNIKSDSSRTKTINSFFFNRLRSLRNFSVYNDDDFSFFMKEQKFPLFSRGIRELSISFCRSVRNDYLLRDSEKEFSNLKVLTLERLAPEFVVTGAWPVLDRLEKLILKQFSIEDKFFEINHFSKLKFLNLSDLPKLAGKFTSSTTTEEMNIFPSLEELKITSSRWSTYRMREFEPDSFFGKIKFDVLEELAISDLEKMSGKGWNRLPMLRSLKMKLCAELEDVFWEISPFPEFCIVKIYDRYIE